MNCASSMIEAFEYEIGALGSSRFLTGTRLPPLGQPTSPMTIFLLGYARCMSA